MSESQEWSDLEEHDEANSAQNIGRWRDGQERNIDASTFMSLKKYLIQHDSQHATSSIFDR